jgi:hypothetical protein
MSDFCLQVPRARQIYNSLDRQWIIAMENAAWRQPAARGGPQSKVSAGGVSDYDDPAEITISSIAQKPVQ